MQPFNLFVTSAPPVTQMIVSTQWVTIQAGQLLRIAGEWSATRSASCSTVNTIAITGAQPPPSPPPPTPPQQQQHWRVSNSGATTWRPA
eukprot:scaffold55361_cov51-Phaeocystis_antarctica.AAC.1